ncbi:MAG: hypothetical protein ACT4QD_11785 [Acidobacteriota bacterium]
MPRTSLLSRKMRFGLGTTACLAATFSYAGSLGALPQSSDARPDVRGGWRADTCTFETGERHPVRGLIVFTATDRGDVTFR